MPFDWNIVKPEFVDCDFRTQPQYVMGDLGPDAAKSGLFRDYEDVVKPLTLKEIDEEIERIEHENAGIENLITRIFNQGQEGSCVGNGSTQAQQIVQAKQFGKDKVTQLSAVSLYQLIGRSPGSGAMVSDAYDELQKTGVVPLDTPENRARFGDVVMPHTGFYTKRPAGCEAVAANFRIDEGLVVRTYEGLLTAGVKGDPAVVGRAGHSITHLRPTKKDGRRYQLYVNSWSENWGFGLAGFKGGFGLDSESYARSSAGWAFVIRSVPVPKWIV